AVDGEALDLGRQGDRAAHRRAGALGGLDDLTGGMIQDPVVEGFEPDAYVLSIHIASSSRRPGQTPCRKLPTLRAATPVTLSKTSPNPSSVSSTDLDARSPAKRSRPARDFARAFAHITP